MSEPKEPKTPKGTWSFNTQLKVGAAGEALFKKGYHSKIEYIKEHYADFTTGDGLVLELKTDTYDEEASPNFFFERYSDRIKKKPGSVWQSLEKGVHLFCYMFIKNGCYYEFRDLTLLQQELESIIALKKLRPIWIKNRGWTAEGYKIEREWLSHLWTRYELKAAKPRKKKEQVWTTEG